MEVEPALPPHLQIQFSATERSGDETISSHHHEIVKTLPDHWLSVSQSLTPMASAAAAAPASSFSLLWLRARNSGSNQREDQQLWRTRVIGQTIRRGGRKTRHSSLGVFALAAQGSEGGRQRAPPGVDTRIHWENEDEGWIGGSNSQSTAAEEDQSSLLGEKFSELLNSSCDSHYQFLGVAVDADMEEIKAAYRRLSKEYHPDTTSLPLKVASDKFMKLREVYDVLSHEQKRNFYDWTLAQEAASRQAEKMRMKLEDPYMKEIENYESVPDLVDQLGGRNLKLSDQAMTALTFDVLIIVFAICCIIYVIFFKEPY